MTDTEIAQLANLFAGHLGQSRRPSVAQGRGRTALGTLGLLRLSQPDCCSVCSNDELLVIGGWMAQALGAAPRTNWGGDESSQKSIGVGVAVWIAAAAAESQAAPAGNEGPPPVTSLSMMASFCRARISIVRLLFTRMDSA